MIIFTTKKESLYQFLSKIRILKKFVRFSLNFIDSIKDKELFVQVIDSVSLANGTYKTTKFNRFRDLDSKLLPLLSNSKTLFVHDMAVSDGITSYELYKKIESHFENINLTISDKYFKILQYRKLGFNLYYTLDGTFVSGSFGGIYVHPNLSNFYAFSKVLGLVAKKIDSSGSINKEIILINPIVRDLLEKQLIQTQEIDIFEDSNFSNSFDFVRCMNILNPLYFGIEELRVAIINIKKSIKEGGILLIGRTDIDSGKNHASFYRLNSGNLELLFHNEKGSEIHDFVK